MIFLQFSKKKKKPEKYGKHVTHDLLHGTYV